MRFLRSNDRQFLAVCRSQSPTIWEELITSAVRSLSSLGRWYTYVVEETVGHVEDVGSLEKQVPLLYITYKSHS